MKTQQTEKGKLIKRACSQRALRMDAIGISAMLLLISSLTGIGDCQGGLFPPARLGRNLAPFSRVEATSTCEEVSGEGHPASYCAPGGSLLTCLERTCDEGCLYESRLSTGLDVLAEGSAGPSVVSLSYYYLNPSLLERGNWVWRIGWQFESCGRIFFSFLWPFSVSLYC